jgi:hypothetical protein
MRTSTVSLGGILECSVVFHWLCLFVLVGNYMLLDVESCVSERQEVSPRRGMVASYKVKFFAVKKIHLLNLMMLHELTAWTE